MKATKIIAHRGFHDIYHENTIGAFLRAIDAGADMIEFDIRKTSDNILIAFHDEFIVSDSVEHRIDQTTFGDLNKIAKMSKYEIPTLRSIFEVCAGQIGMDIEFKVDGCIDETFAHIDNFECASNCIITSFNTTIIEKVLSLRPEQLCGLLIDDISSVNKDLLTSLTLLCPSSEQYLKNSQLFTSWKQQGKSLAVWTVDDNDLIKKYLIDPVIDTIITNETEQAITLRNSISKWSKHGCTA